jgi:ferredoxin
LNPRYKATEESAEAGTFDLLRVVGVGRFLCWRHSRTLLQIPLLIVSIIMILHGLFGPALAPKNLATTLSWVHFRGVLVLVLLCAGNFFCLSCPFMLMRQMARRFFHPSFNWPRKLRNKWLSTALFVLILFAYELFDLWSSPWWTAWLIIGYFLTALAVDGLFKHASFCKYVCPIGQFNFVASLVSPLVVKVRDQIVCSRCKTRDCIRGSRTPGADLVVIQRGCELALFQPLKVGNMDCTFCLDCVHACPHDNVGILSRIPATELLTDPRRSGIGLFSRRKDLSALATVFTFGALLNAFAMLSPVYALENWLQSLFGWKSEASVLGIIFGFFLIAAPVLLLGAAAWTMRTLIGGRRTLLSLMARYSYGLVPLGFGIWLAHYGFHLLTGLFTLIPVTQNAAASLGEPLLGAPRWTMTGIPSILVQPLELGFLLLGLAGSLLVMYRLAEDDSPVHATWTFAPWAVMCGLVWLGALWVIIQPMEMRGTFLSG